MAPGWQLPAVRSGTRYTRQPEMLVVDPPISYGLQILTDSLSSHHDVVNPHRAWVVRVALGARDAEDGPMMVAWRRVGTERIPMCGLKELPLEGLSVPGYDPGVRLR